MRALFVVLFATLPSLAAAGPVKASVRYLHIEEGYDHLNRLDVLVDGQVVASSAERPQSKKNKVRFELPEGAQTVQLVNYALYEGQWEIHSILNNYSIDCLWELPAADARARGKLDLLCDLDRGPRLK